MNKKMIGIMVCLVLVTATAVSSANFTSQKNIKSPPLPGHLKDGKLDLIRDHEINHEKSEKTITQTSYNENIATLIQEIDEDLYLGYLEGLVAFGPRLTSTPECDAAAEYIYNEFEKMGLETRYQEWTNDPWYGSNVEATIHGIDENSDEIYVICAHYDTVEESPGADDDGSGTAAVMTAAKVMSQYSFNNTIKFVAFSGEEEGLYGSYYYVEEADNNNDNIMAALNADMIGYAESEDDASMLRIYEDEFSVWITDFTTDISNEYNNFIEIEVVPSGYSWGSDHYRFWEFGYSAIFYAEYNFNAYYHSPEDTVENMDIDYATRATRLITATLAEFSELVELNAPFKPNAPIGPASGNKGEEYTYIATTIDPQQDQLYYFFEWGDGTDSGWIGPFNSGEEASETHTWSKVGDYAIKVKAKDTEGYESEWSDPLSVSMPRNRDRFSVLSSILQNKFPRIYRFLSLPIFNL